MILQWKASYNIGIKEIDDQHQELFRIFNELVMVKKEGAGEDAFFFTLNALVKYAETHFETEERHMKDHLFPELEEHHRIHDDFILKVFNLRSRQQEKKAAIGTEIIDFIRNWLHDHVIYIEDRKFQNFLNRKAR